MQRLYQQYRSRGDIHGLYEIREAALAWVNRSNAAQNTNWETSGPDLRIVVARCAVPLTVKWTDPSRHAPGRTGVDVVCSRSVNPQYGKKWDVFVPVYRRKGRA